MDQKTREEKENLVSAIMCSAFGVASEKGIVIDIRFDYRDCARDIVDLFDDNAVIKSANDIVKE